MSLSVTLRDRTTFGKETGSRVIENLSETVTLRELIQRRVTEEVEEFNRNRPEFFRGLVQPTDAETTLNGYRLRKPDPAEIGLVLVPGTLIHGAIRQVLGFRGEFQDPVPLPITRVRCQRSRLVR